ncbi:MAG TPA: hypothetical protein VMT85_09095 [Thermoanaerobaculia bacterium]|nr:hypothetical protein [Thermoanaerobaculia bacterium]
MALLGEASDHDIESCRANQGDRPKAFAYKGLRQRSRVGLVVAYSLRQQQPGKEVPKKRTHTKLPCKGKRARQDGGSAPPGARGRRSKRRRRVAVASSSKQLSTNKKQKDDETTKTAGSTSAEEKEF